MRYGRSRHVAELLYELSAVIKELLRTENGRRHVRQVVCSLWKAVHARTHEPMLRSFHSIDQSGAEEVVTIAESLLAKCRAEGEEVGRDKTANSVLKRPLRRFPEASPELRNRGLSAEVDALLDWTVAIEAASNVEDLLDA